MTTDWKIVRNENDPIFGYRIDAEGDSVWPLFFTGVDLRSYPKMIETVVEEIGFSSNRVGITFPGDLDPDDTPIPDEMIEIDHQDFGSEYLNTYEFYQILLEFSRTILENRDDRSTTSDWIKDMSYALELLQKKING